MTWTTMSASPTPEAILEARSHLDSVQGVFITATEWGLFNDNPTLENSLRDNLCKMAHLLSKAEVTWKDLADFECLLVETWSQFNTGMNAWNLRAVYYRLNAHWGVVQVAFAILSSLLAAAAVAWSAFNVPTIDDLKAPVFAGIAGALLKSLYWTQFQNAQGALRPRFFAYFLGSGFVGAILGWASSLLIEVSFRVLGEGANTPEPDWKVLALIAIFAGYRWEWVLAKLEKGAELLTQKFGVR